MSHLPPISEVLPDAPPMPAFHQVRSLKAGPLTKQGSLFKSWKKRLFILQDAFLLYYVSPEDTSPRGALWIKECCVREETDVSRLQTAKTGSPVYCFSLQCYKSWNIEAKRTFRERTYLLLADSFQDMSDWMAILRTMARASADIDAEFEQSYLQAFASNDSFSTPSSAGGSTNADGSDGGMGAASSEPIGRHKRSKSKSVSTRKRGHHHGAGAGTGAGMSSADGTGSSGGSSTGSLARPRTPLASSSNHSSSSAGTSSSAAAAAVPSMLQIRDRGAAGASSSSSSSLQAGGGGGAAATGSGGANGGGGGGGGASMSGGTGVSFSSGPADTPRASISQSLSDSRSSLTHNSVTQRRRADSDAELQEHMLPMHIAGGSGNGGVARAAQPIGLAAANKGAFTFASPPTAAHSLSSLQSPHSPSSHSSSLVEGDTDQPRRSLTPLAGQQGSLTPRRKHTAVAVAQD